MSDRLSEIEERIAAATPGVWKLWGMDVLADQDGTSDVDTAVPVATTRMLIDGKPRTFDAELVAHAPTDLAALVKFAREVEVLHQREDHRDSHGKRYAICGRCLNFRGEYVDWPCATAKAIQRLGGAE